MSPTDATRRSAPDAALYPEIEPYASGRLPLDALHTMHWEACGNATGMPLVFLHGGPGGGCLPHHRRYYDPAFWNIVLYDQRGAGRSTPVAALVDNTTQHLVADLERLREIARASSAGSCSADRGARRSRSRTRRRIPTACWASCCAASSSRREQDAGRPRSKKNIAPAKNVIVFRCSGVVRAAVSVSGPIQRLSRKPGAKYGAVVAEAARRIEHAAGLT